MRPLMTVSIPVESGNRAIKEGLVEKILSEFHQNHRPEAAYFTTRNGLRTMFLVVDIKDTSYMPAIAEPFFSQFGAHIDFSPVMNLEELKKGIEMASKGTMAGAR